MKLWMCAVMAVAAGCDVAGSVAGEPDAGGDAGTGTNIPEGSSCTCLDLSDNCCATGLFCDAPVKCNVITSTGCYTEGSCQKKRAIGQICDDARQCAAPMAYCAGPLNGPSTCGVSSTDLDASRCQTSGDCSSADGIRRVCSNTYCKRMAGETCTASNQCESNKCYGSTSYACL